MALLCSPLTRVVWAGPPFAEFIDPHPAPGNRFGNTVVALSTGNVVITSPFDDAGGTDAGAVYLFNGATGALISTLTGTKPLDHIGLGGVTALSNGNYVVKSPDAHNGAAANAGAVTWGSGVTGVSGIVSVSNSLVGSTTDDQIGSSGVKPLAHGNYVVISLFWDNGVATNAGAVTWGSGTSGVSGIVGVSNSLVGTTSNDIVGVYGVAVLLNGNYVVSSPHWDNGAAADAGAVTWGSGETGVSGVVSGANSLIGSRPNDLVGDNFATVVPVMVLANGNYVVSSPQWDNGLVEDVGAVTWGNGSTGVSGPVSASNSLIGSSPHDWISDYAFIPLTNGHYVIGSPHWDNGPVADVGAATWVSGATGVIGAVGVSNSLVGSAPDDEVGRNVTALINGNYVVGSPRWHNAGVANAGAVTWGNGSTGTIGVVGLSNSLIGWAPGDAVGGCCGVRPLTNGNYVVPSIGWDNGAVADVGAATWGSGTTGVSGVVSPSNSLVGSAPGDQVGMFLASLTNGNYVVSSPDWDNGAATDAGAVTWGNGTTGTLGVVGPSNSLVGTTPNDKVGYSFVTPLTNGNYVVTSGRWDGGAVDVGAVTWGNGTSGVKGAVNASNSLVGSSANDQVGQRSEGDSRVRALTNGNYIVGSPNWDNGVAADAGAVTWGSGTSGVNGLVSASNSLVGSTQGDFVYSVVTLANGNYVVVGGSWDNAGLVDAGAVAWANGSGGTAGTLGPKSLVGTTSNSGLSGVVADNVNGTYLATFPSDGGGRVRLGSLLDGIPTPPVLGPASFSNLTLGSADVSGSVTSDNGFAVIGRGFIYSMTATNNAPTLGGTGVTPVPVAGTIGAMGATLSGLVDAASYSFRGYATNSTGTSYTAVVTFTTLTPAPPDVVTDAASGPTQTGATLNGTINPHGGVTNRRFEFGETNSYGIASPRLSIGNGNTDVPVSFTATGLACNTLHHYRAVGQNGGGTTFGSDATFTTAACPPTGQGNISATTARSLSINSAVQDTLSTVRTEVWYRTGLFANRSYQISLWTVDEEGTTAAGPIAVDLFSDAGGTTLATPSPTPVSAGLEGSPNHATTLSQSTLFQPLTTGAYRIRVLGAPAVAPTSVNVMLRETTLFSPWTSRAAGFEGFIEMHNNTNAPISVTLRAYDVAGALQSAGLTMTLQANATDFRTATQVGVPVGVFAGVVLTHNGAFGAVSANVTTLNGANGLSFDSPFGPRDSNIQAKPVR